MHTEMCVVYDFFRIHLHKPYVYTCVHVCVRAAVTVQITIFSYTHTHSYTIAHTYIYIYIHIAFSAYIPNCRYLRNDCVRDKNINDFIYFFFKRRVRDLTTVVVTRLLVYIW